MTILSSIKKKFLANESNSWQQEIILDYIK